MLALKKIIQEIAIDAKETGKKYLDEFGDNFENWTEEARKDIALKSTLLRDTVYFLKEQIRGAARVTQAGNISVTRAGGKRLNVDEVNNMTNKLGSANPNRIKKYKVKGKNMSNNFKRTIISLLFGISLAISFLVITRKFGFPYEGLANWLSIMISIWVVNFKDRIFK